MHPDAAKGEQQRLSGQQITEAVCTRRLKKPVRKIEVACESTWSFIMQVKID